MFQQQVDDPIAGPPSTQWKVTRSRQPSHIHHHSYHHWNIRSGEEVTETTEETTNAVEEATTSTADPAVAWARGASSRQVGQDLPWVIWSYNKHISCITGNTFCDQWLITQCGVTLNDIDWHPIHVTWTINCPWMGELQVINYLPHTDDLWIRLHIMRPNKISPNAD